MAETSGDPVLRSVKTGQESGESGADAESLQGLRQIPWERAVDHQTVTGLGVVEGQLAGVKREAPESAALPEDPIDLAIAQGHVSDHRVVDPPQVATNLVFPSGLKAHLEPRGALDTLEGAVAGPGLDGLAPVSSERGVHQAFLGSVAPDQGPVDLGHRAGFELVVKEPSGFAVQGHEQGAARGPVQPMDGVDVATHEIPNALQGVGGVLGEAAMHGES